MILLGQDHDRVRTTSKVLMSGAEYIAFAKVAVAAQEVIEFEDVWTLNELEARLEDLQEIIKRPHAASGYQQRRLARGQPLID